jgi:hypothetical protein
MFKVKTALSLILPLILHPEGVHRLVGATVLGRP